MLKRLAVSAWNLFNRVTNGMTLVTGEMAGVAIFLLAVCVVVDVFLRYAFGKPTIWINEAAGYTLLVITFLGLAYTLRENAHIKVLVVVSRLPSQIQDWMKVISSVVSLIVISILFKLTWDLFMQSVEGGTTSATMWDVPLAPWQVFIPFGLAVIGVLLICNLYAESKIALGKSKEAHEESG